MKCIVGLGNPGEQYRKTRHNAGFLAVEFLAERLRARHLEGTDEYECFQAAVNGETLLLLFPQTYMNGSGAAVQMMMQKYDVTTDELMIIYDDFQIPFGTLRIRPHGSDGGHNGIASIIEHLGSGEIPRLRFGVGGVTIPASHTHDAMADYVLAPFTAEEEKLLALLFGHVSDACLLWMNSGIQRSMNRYNKNFFSSAGAE